MKYLRQLWNCFRGRHVPFTATDCARVFTVCEVCMKPLPTPLTDSGLARLAAEANARDAK